jgi:hypothetical protein
MPVAFQYGLVERTLFARIEAGDDRNALKRDFPKRFGITARQFKAAHTELGGTISSEKGRQPELIDDLKDGSRRRGGY